jgi:uncharacterized protein
MKIACPECGKETLFENNINRPFCSKECKNKDFLNWTNEAYEIHSKNKYIPTEEINHNGDT